MSHQKRRGNENQERIKLVLISFLTLGVFQPIVTLSETFVQSPQLRKFWGKTINTQEIRK
jgi:hypothetical protein